MPLLGKAALLLCFDIVPEARSEHDDWHTHEHLPERLSIPGFLRGTRWAALRGQPGYSVLYEVEHLDTLVSEAYLQRLNHPSPWTARMMVHYRAMTRGLCSVRASCGSGMGHLGLLIRFKPAADASSTLGHWLAAEVIPGLPVLPGLGSAHLLEGAVAAQMTNEQRIRGADQGVDWAVLVTGYQQDRLEDLTAAALAPARLEARGAQGVISSLYKTDYTLTNRDIDAKDQVVRSP